MPGFALIKKVAHLAQERTPERVVRDMLKFNDFVRTRTWEASARLKLHRRRRECDARTSISIRGNKLVCDALPEAHARMLRVTVEPSLLQSMNRFAIRMIGRGFVGRRDIWIPNAMPDKTSRPRGAIAI